MKNLINKQNLEKLLISKWTSFMDSRQLIAFTLLNVRDKRDDFQVIKEDDELPKKNVQVTIERFEPCEDGFVVWIDYTVPHENEIIVGTIETNLTLNGNLTLSNIIGTRFSN